MSSQKISQVIHPHKLSQLLISLQSACKSSSKGLARLNDRSHKDWKDTETGQ
ncbi:mCG148340 [Mus musculus]|nr:mCG148340 [Mus musculus]